MRNNNNNIYLTIHSKHGHTYNVETFIHLVSDEMTEDNKKKIDTWIDNNLKDVDTYDVIITRKEQ